MSLVLMRRGNHHPDTASVFCLLCRPCIQVGHWTPALPTITQPRKGIRRLPNLFELLSAESLKAHGWEVGHVGRAPGRAIQFADAVAQVAEFMDMSLREGDR